MLLEEILNQWDEDTKIDYSELGEEARKIPRLTAKFLRLLAQEKMTLKNLEALYRKLYVEKSDYYVEGPANIAEYETKVAIWKTVPERGKSFLRSAVGQYLDVDQDLEELRLKKELAQVKVDALEMIMKSIMNRGFLINNMIQWQQFVGGGK